MMLILRFRGPLEGQRKFSLRQENFLLTTSRKGNRVRLHLLNHILCSRVSLLSSETPHVKDKNRKEGSHQINHRRKCPGAQTQVWDIPITEQKFPHLNIFLGNFETSGRKTSRGRKISTKELASPTLLDAGR